MGWRPWGALPSSATGCEGGVPILFKVEGERRTRFNAAYVLVTGPFRLSPVWIPFRGEVSPDLTPFDALLGQGSVLVSL